ncbi:MAG: pyridoxamine kinase [Candidatus Methanomethylophilaceae archaeon]|jgi:pyridoxine kinase|nr:pyridoxamine kinase [Candidatus Methanomethylophilaceae archaeon]
MKAQKRVAAIHDISCFGKCSLTVALPIISAAGIEVPVIPTAVLSTHTGGFEGYTYRDLTDDIMPIVEHWESLGLGFDALYTGFLGSFAQIRIVEEIFERLGGEDAKVFVDPVMADNGKLYGIFPADFPEGMRRLCSRADVIMPNITEAVLMTGGVYEEGPYTEEYVEGMLERLAAIGAEEVVLTGVHFTDDRLGAASFDAAGDVRYAFADRVPGYYHGTGDVFGSALVGAAVNGLPLSRAVEIAVDFTAGSIARTHAAGTDVRFGVDFESGIPGYVRALGLKG